MNFGISVILYLVETARGGSAVGALERGNSNNFPAFQFPPVELRAASPPSHHLLFSAGGGGGV